MFGTQAVVILFWYNSWNRFTNILQLNYLTSRYLIVPTGKNLIITLPRIIYIIQSAPIQNTHIEPTDIKSFPTVW